MPAQGVVAHSPPLTVPAAPAAPPPAAPAACAPRGAAGHASAGRRLRRRDKGRGQLDVTWLGWGHSWHATQHGSTLCQAELLNTAQHGRSQQTQHSTAGTAQQHSTAQPDSRSRITMSSWPLSSWISCWYRAIRLLWSMISLRATLTSMRLALRAGKPGAQVGWGALQVQHGRAACRHARCLAMLCPTIASRRGALEVGLDVGLSLTGWQT